MNPADIEAALKAATDRQIYSEAARRRARKRGTKVVDAETRTYLDGKAAMMRALRQRRKEGNG